MMKGCATRARRAGASLSDPTRPKLSRMTRHPVPMAQLSICAAVALFLCTVGALVARADTKPDPKLGFNRDVQPILSENCYFCHGTDKNQRKAGLRLDSSAEATRDLGKGRHAVMPGKSG